MSRMKIKTDNVESRLFELEGKYKEAKCNEKIVKKAVTELGEEIKTLMVHNGMDKFGSLSVTVTQKEEFNEPQAIEILRNTLSEEEFSQVVKTKEYIDDDALEKLAYNSSFDMSILAGCKTLGKKITTLRVRG